MHALKWFFFTASQNKNWNFFCFDLKKVLYITNFVKVTVQATGIAALTHVNCVQYGGFPLACKCLHKHLSVLLWS